MSGLLRAGASAAVLLLLAACSRPAPVVVASSTTTEQQILAEIVTQRLERAGLPVERAKPYPSLATAHQALIEHAADVLVEYSGAAWMAMLHHDGRDLTHLADRIRPEYAAVQLKWFESLGFGSPFGLLVRRADVLKLHPSAISEAARAHPWTLEGTPEFLLRPDGYDALMAAYPELRWTATPDRADPAALYRALRGGAASMIAGETTNAGFGDPAFCALADDRHRLPPEDAAVVARFDALNAFPALEPALAALSGSISQEAVRRMNDAVELQHRSAREVAAEFLARR